MKATEVMMSMGNSLMTNCIQCGCRMMVLYRCIGGCVMVYLLK
ncbi:hypothetical protein [Phocaeicola paurosaccharolyticus]|nr:hypothetical protein [Phocaeicola paurosaccharolyticus]